MLSLTPLLKSLPWMVRPIVLFHSLVKIDGSALLQPWAASVCTPCFVVLSGADFVLLPLSMTLCLPALCAIHLQAYKTMQAAGGGVRSSL